MVKILLVEDNETIVMGLEYLLSQEGFCPGVAGNVGQALELLEGEKWSLVLLDVSLPDGDGFLLCREIKKKWKLPVIFLTAKEEERDVVKGFDLGADDYIIKPFRNRELVSRIRNVLRRSGQMREELFCGDLKMDLATGKVTRGGREIILTKLEYRILQSMLSYPGKIFTREEILAEVWDASGNFVNDNTLSVTMKRMREKLGDPEGKLLRTVRGLGYRLEDGK